MNKKQLQMSTIGAVNNEFSKLFTQIGTSTFYIHKKNGHVYKLVYPKMKLVAKQTDKPEIYQKDDIKYRLKDNKLMKVIKKSPVKSVEIKQEEIKQTEIKQETIKQTQIKPIENIKQNENNQIKKKETLSKMEDIKQNINPIVSPKLKLTKSVRDEKFTSYNIISHKERDVLYQEAENKNYRFFFTEEISESGAQKFYAAQSLEVFLDMYKTVNYLYDTHFHEMIPSFRPRYEYFDIDLKVTNSDINAKNVFINFRDIHSAFMRNQGVHTDEICNTKYYITDSSTSEKISLHIVNRSRVFSDYEEMKIWTDEFIKFFNSEHVKIYFGVHGLDSQVYAPNKTMRMIGSSKYGQNRPFKQCEFHPDSNEAMRHMFFITGDSDISLMSKEMKKKRKQEKEERLNEMKEMKNYENEYNETEYKCIENNSITCLVNLILDLVRCDKHEKFIHETSGKLSYSGFFKLVNQYINACKIKKINESTAKQYYDDVICEHFENTRKRKMNDMWASIWNKKEKNTINPFLVLHSWARIHEEYEDKFTKTQKEIELGYVDICNRDYFWYDFTQQLKQTFDTKQDAINFIKTYFNQVCVTTTQGGKPKFYLKDKDEPFLFVEHINFKIFYKTEKIKKKEMETIKHGDYLKVFLEDNRECLREYANTYYQPYDYIKNTEQVNINGREFNTYFPPKANYLGQLSDEQINKLNPVLNHISQVYANDHIDRYTKILDLLSHIVQFPWIMPKIMLILHSDEKQIGKGIVFEWLINQVFGTHIAGKTSDPSKVSQRFNSFLDKKNLIVFDDMSTHENYKADYFEDMKSLITDPTQTIEKKGVDVGKSKQIYPFFVVLTNHINALKIEQGDKRCLLFKCSSRYENNTDYFDALGKVLKNDEIADIMYTYLYNRKIEGNIREIIDTEERREAINSTAPYPHRFLRELQAGDIEITLEQVEGDYNYENRKKNLVLPETEKYISSNLLFQNFKNWCIKNEIKHNYNNQTFPGFIKKFFGNKGPGDAIIGYDSNGEFVRKRVNRFLLSSLKIDE